jgi:hypothetical protein
MFARILAAVGAALLALIIGAGPAAADTTPDVATATFTPGTTDGLFPVSGTVKFTQSVPGAPITASGTVTGLPPNTAHTTVLYKDGACLPLVGVSAFPSGAFFTDATGSATFSVPLQPNALNPVGSVNVNQTRSVSIRSLLVNSVVVPGVISTPNIPNGAAVQACAKGSDQLTVVQ